MIDRKEHLHELIADFGSAMLTSRVLGGQLHVRPMAVAKVCPDEQLYFATGLTSPKVGEIHENPAVVVTFQSRSEFVALYGTARIVRESAVINELWSEGWRVWFPDGKDD